MKNPLESLLSLKRWEEDEARNLFVTAKQGLDEEEERLEGLERSFSEIRESFRIRGKKASSIDEIRQVQTHMERLVTLLQHQKDAVEMSRKRLDDATRIMEEAQKERKIFEKVDEKNKAVEKHEKQKKEEKDIDEHAVMRYKKRDK
jgi:flagellar FliJ protein